LQRIFLKKIRLRSNEKYQAIDQTYLSKQGRYPTTETTERTVFFEFPL